MISTLKNIWLLFVPNERRKATAMLLLVILMAITEAAGVLSIMPFLSVLGRPDIVQENPWLHGLFEASGIGDIRRFTIALGIASIAIVVASSIFKVVTQHVLNRFIHFLRHSISARLLAKYLRQPYTFFLSRNTAELNKNILSETDQLLFNLIQPLAQLIAQGTVVLAMSTLMIAYDPWMAISIIVVVGGLYALIYGLVRQRLERSGIERVAANHERYQASNEALVGIKDVKVTHSAAAYVQRFSRASRTYSRHLATSDTLSQTPLFLVEAVGYSGLILIALLLLMRSDDIAHVLPALGLYGFAAYRMLPAAQIMYRGLAKLKFSSPAMAAIHHDLALSEEAEAVSGDVIVPQREIRLEGIRFAYPASPDKPVLDSFHLTIPARGSIGIVGKSGAGKSTLMDLLLGLLRPQAGALYVDTKAIDSGNMAAWQRSIGYVPQQIFLSDASVAENIAFGIPKHDIDMRAVERAAGAAQIHDFIIGELPDGYATPIGERGMRLSGGQRQRIGIARALYGDPPVLCMDEATSALDSQTEEAVNEAIRNLTGDKTIIVIAHRASSLAYCANVVYMPDPAASATSRSFYR